MRSPPPGPGPGTNPAGHSSAHDPGRGRGGGRWLQDAGRLKLRLAPKPSRLPARLAGAHASPGGSRLPGSPALQDSRGAVPLQAPAQGHWCGLSLASQLISHPPLVEQHPPQPPHFWRLVDKTFKKDLSTGHHFHSQETEGSLMGKVGELHSSGQPPPWGSGLVSPEELGPH